MCKAYSKVTHIKQQQRSDSMNTLLTYVCDTWLENDVWPVSSLSASRCEPTMTLRGGTVASTSRLVVARCRSTCSWSSCTRRQALSACRCDCWVRAVCAGTHVVSTLPWMAGCRVCGTSFRPERDQLPACCVPALACSCQTGWLALSELANCVDPGAEFFFANTPADHFFRLRFG